MRVASAPVSFGVDEILVDDAWMPEPDDMLDWMVDIGFEGTELGPPGYLGDAAEVHERLTSRATSSSSARSSRSTSAGPRRPTRTGPGCATACRLVSDGVAGRLHAVRDPVGPLRRARPARLLRPDPGAPETWLSPARFDTLIDNLHRAAEVCRAEGFEPVLHPHAGTYIETADEIARVMDRIDPSIIGLCLDTGHFRFGGADPTQSVARLPRAHPPRPHQGLPDVGDGRGRRREGKGLDEALRRGVFCPLGEGDSRHRRA